MPLTDLTDPQNSLRLFAAHLQNSLRLFVAHPPAELIWGLLSRGLGLCFLVSFASIAVQVLPIAGAQGITPIRDALAAIRRDFPGLRRFVYFPSLLWLQPSDALLLALPRLGMLAAASCIVGGPHVPYAFAFCYLAYLSLDRPLVLVYPWDCLLFEAGFFAIFLPATHVLPSVSAVAAPLPALAWVYRLLVFRVMFGFGKHKFFGKTSQDSGFLKTFLVNQPLPTPAGWLAQKLPMPIMKLGLFAMFVAEIPLPLAVFFPGLWSSVAGLATIAFMLVIWLSGNFGYFNLAMVVLSLSWLDNTTAEALSLPRYWSGALPAGTLALHALIALHFTLASWAFPFNTFCAQTWMQWSIWTRVRPRVLVWPIALARALHPLRLAHAYGVFPPRTAPPGRIMPVIEATWDERVWHTLTFRYAPTLPTSKPSWCAPHHERFDQAAVYEGLGLNESSVFRNIVGRWDPYGSGGVPATRVLLARMLDGNVPGDRFYDRARERQHGAPLAVRARGYFFSPASWDESDYDGVYFQRTLAGPHHGPVRKGETYLPAALPPPELWHYDDRIWLERSKLGALLRRAARSEDPHALVLTDGDGLEAADAARFWNELMPRFAPRHQESWHGLRATRDELLASYDPAQRHRFERLAERYALMLFARLEPLFLDGSFLAMFGLGKSKLEAKNNYQLRLLCCQIVLEGRAAFDTVFATPERANDTLARFAMHRAAYLRALFRYEELIFQASHLRALQAFTDFENRQKPDEKAQRTIAYVEGVVRRAWGVVDYGEFLRTQFLGAEDQLDVPEAWPRFRFTANGDVERVPEDTAER